MGTKEKVDFISKCMAAAPKIFGIILVVCTLFLGIASWVMPSEGGKPVADCKVFEAEWYCF